MPPTLLFKYFSYFAAWVHPDTSNVGGACERNAVPIPLPRVASFIKNQGARILIGWFFLWMLLKLCFVQFFV